MSTDFSFILFQCIVWKLLMLSINKIKSSTVYWDDVRYLSDAIDDKSLFLVLVQFLIQIYF